MAVYKFWAGGYCEKDGDGVNRMQMDEAGNITRLGTFAEPNPSYLAQTGDILITAREARGECVGAYRICGDRLEKLSEVNFGASPCHVLTRGNRVYAACYGSGILAAVKVHEDGTLECDRTVNFKEFPMAVGLNPRTHMVNFTPDGGYITVIDLGLDRVFLFKLDEDGKFGTEPDFAYKLPDGFGPRHCAYSPDGKYCYVCGEYSNHVAAFAYGDGKLELIEIYNAVPDDFDGVTYCGGLRFTQDGRYLLVGNRGHNTIAVFTALEGGKLGKVKWFDIMGCWPREFALTPDEKFVVVANQRSNTLDVLSFDKETGDMAPVSSFDYYQPAAVLFS